MRLHAAIARTGETTGRAAVSMLIKVPIANAVDVAMAAVDMPMTAAMAVVMAAVVRAASTQTDVNRTLARTTARTGQEITDKRHVSRPTGVAQPELTFTQMAC